MKNKYKLLSVFALFFTLFIISTKNSYGAVAFDTSSESHTGTAGSTNQTSFTWNHGGSASIKGVVVFVYTMANADDISTVTYGGVTMTEVVGGDAQDTASVEAGRTTTFFLGSSVPTGTQAVVVNRTNNGDELYAVAMSVTAASDTEVNGIVLLQEDGTLAEQSVTDGSPGSNSVRFAGVMSGLASPPAAGASSTATQSIDFGNRVAAAVRETTAGQGARNIGFSSGTSDDRAAVHLAVREARITVSGTVLSSAGGTETVCDTNTGTFELSLRTSSTTYTATCTDSTGAFSFTNVLKPTAGDGIVIWIEALATDGSVVTRYSGTGDSTNNTLYESTVSVTSDDTNAVSISNMDTYDNGNDTDIPFTTTIGSPNTLSVSSNFDLRVNLKSGVASGSNVFTPVGTVTTQGTGNFKVDTNAKATLDTATNTVAADILVSGGATLNINASTGVNGGDITTSGTSATVTTTSGTPTVTMSGTGSIGGGTTPTLTFYDLTTTGTGTTTLTNNTTINNNVTIGSSTTLQNNGTLTTTGSITDNGKLIIASTLSINGGSLTTSGTGVSGVAVSYSGTPSTSIGAAGTIGGGTGSITLYSLTMSGGGTYTISTDLVLDRSLVINGGTFSLGTKNMTIGSASISGSGVLTVNSGGISQSSSGTTTVKAFSGEAITFGGNGCTSTNCTFGNLDFKPTAASAPTFTIASGIGQRIDVAGALTIGNGTNAVNVTANTNNPTINVTGAMTVNAGGGVFTSASSSTLTVGGAFTNSGTFSGTGALDFNGDFSNSGSGSFTAPASASFTIAGSFTNGASATFAANNGTVTLDATTGSPAITSAGDSFYNLSIDNGGTVKTWTLSDALDVNGNFLLDTSNTLSTSTNNINVAGNWTNNGTYTASNTTTFDAAGGTTQVITGTTTFNNLTITTTTTRTIQFAASTTYSIATSANLTLTGTDCNNLLIIRSGTAGTQFTLTDNTGGTTTLSYIDIQDSSATNAETATNSINSGNNTNWTIAANACKGGSNNSNATNYSFQRKTFKDDTNSRHWLFFYDGNQIDYKYSSDNGSTWNTGGTLAYNTNDFSVWQSKISTTEYIWLAVASGNDIILRRGTLGASSITWDSASPAVIPFDGTGSTDTYANVYISADSSNYLWIIASYHDTSNYVMKAIRSSNTGDTTWTAAAFTFTTAAQISDNQTSSNIYGNIVPLASQDMYAAFVDGTALEGCKWVNSSSTWKDSGGNNCSPVLGTADTEGSSTRSATVNVKIDDASNFGAMNGGRQIIQTSNGRLYTFISGGGTCQIWGSTDGGASWSEQDSAHHPSCSGGGSAVAMALGSDDTIHMVYLVDDATSQDDLYYISFSNNLFSSSARIYNGASIIPTLGLAIDANNVPHVAFSNTGNVYYLNKVGGTWDASPTQISANTSSSVSITISEDNIPEVSFIINSSSTLSAAVGNQNDATSFTVQSVDTSVNSTGGQRGSSIGIDSIGNTWIAYTDGTTNYATLIKHNDADAWTTWQSSITNSNVGYEPTLSVIGKTLFVFYENDDTTHQAAYDAYDMGTSAWLGENVLTSAGSAKSDVKVRYSKYNFREPWFLDYLYSDGTDLYWNYVNLRTIKIDDPGDPGIMLHSGRQVFKISDGTLYAVDNDGGVIEMWKSSDGYVWAQKGTGPSTRNAIAIAAAMDSSGNIGIAYPHSTTNWDIDYVLFSSATDSFGTPDTSILGTYTYDANGVAIAFDSGSKPHVVVASDSFSGTYTASVEYTNKISGSWSAKKTIESFTNASSHRLTTPDITIDQNNYPQIAYLNVRDSTLSAVVGDANNPTTFGTPNDIETSVNVTDGQKGVSIAVDTLTGNTWIGTIDTDNSVDLEKHTGATWTTNWTTSISHGDSGKEPSIAIAGADKIYIFYANSGDDISYNVYDSVASSWGTETVLHAGTYQDTKVKWSYLNNNFGANKIDYLYSDGTDIYYDYFYVRRSPTKIDDASNFGVLQGSSRQVVRDSNGNLYSVVVDGTNNTLEVWESMDNGNSWSEQDSTNHPTANNTGADSAAAAIDSSNTLHIAYANGDDIYYVTFSTTFGTPVLIINNPGSTSPQVDGLDISIDSNDAPHVVASYEYFSNPFVNYALNYVNETSGTWQTSVTIDSNTDNGPYPNTSVTINEDDIPEITYIDPSGFLVATVGNANNATSFSSGGGASFSVDQTVGSASTTSIAIDSTGNTWIAYKDSDGSVTLAKHDDATSWTTSGNWHFYTDTKAGNYISLIINVNGLYVLYEDDQNDIVYDKYDGSVWSGETQLDEHAVLQNTKAHWSYFNNYDSNGIAPVQTNTYFFDNSDNCVSGTSCQDPNSVWTNDANTFDSDMTTNNASTTTAGSTSSNYLRGDGTNAPGSGGTIVSVKARVKGSYTVSSTAVNAAVYSGAELLGTPSVTNSSATWSSYTTLTAPTGGWTWSAIQALSTRIYSSTGGGATGLAWGVQILIQTTNTAMPNEMDYLYSDGTDAYYNRVLLGGTPGSQDAIDTVPTGLSKTLSAVTDSTNHDVHLVFVDDEATDQISYRRWDNGTSTWQSAINLDSSNNDAYPSISVDTNTNDLAVFYIDTSTGHIFYRTCDESAASAECSASGDWAAETDWKSGTNSSISASYGETSEWDAVWTVGTTQVTVNWDRVAATLTLSFSQNGYRWYVDNDTANPTDAWSATTGIDLAEDTAITVTPVTYDPPDTTQELRLRVNLVVNNTSLTSSSVYFKLQYKAATDGICTGSGWTDVNTGSAWTYATSSVTDGSAITGSLSDTGVSENYIKSKTSSANTNSATQGQKIEYDFHIIGASSASTTQYSFRVVQTDATGTPTTALDAYTNCAVLTTEPGTADEMRHGQIKTEGSNASGFFWAN